MKNFYQKQRLVAAILAITLMLFMFPNSLWASSGITGTTPSTRCNAGSVVLHATAASGTIKWYDVPFYGTAFPTGVSAKGTVSADGTTFTTASISKTTTYYVDAVDANGCSLNTGNARIPVIATVTSGSIQSNIFYPSQFFCSSLSQIQTVTRTGTAGGTYSATPAGLALGADGSITPNSSSVGNYTITYTVASALGCVEVPATTTVNITDNPLTSSLVYSGSPYCTSLTSAAVSLTNPNGGSFLSSPAGLSLDAVTGTIYPSASQPGTYTVTYLVSGAGGCAPQAPTTSVTITGLPTAVINYADATLCKDVVASQLPGLSGTGAYTGGTFSYTGVSLNSFNASTGAFVPNASTAGSYTISYLIPASGNCVTVTETTPVTINPLPNGAITGSTVACQNGTAPDITFTGSNGTAPYTFSYKVGADGATQTVTTVSGNSITVSQSTVSAGTYLYTLLGVTDANGCSYAASGTATITITGTPVATFNYPGSPYCKSGTATTALIGDGTRGVFSGTGVTFESTSTGEIDLVNTPAGTYTITNTISSCGGVTSTASLTIIDLPVATITGTLTACGSTTLSAVTSATAPTFAWYKNGTAIGGATSQDYIALTSGSYAVNVTDGITNCSAISVASVVTINAIPTSGVTGNPIACGNSTLTVTTDAGSPTFAWYKDASLIVGATSSTYAVTANGSYTAKVTNGGCSATSDAFVVTVYDLPTATLSGGGTACGSTTLTAGSDATNKSYSWYKNGVVQAGEVASTYSATATGSYAVKVTNSDTGCEKLSDAVSVTIHTLPTATVTGALTSCVTPITLTASSGTSYQWSKDNAGVYENIPGATGSTYAAAVTGYYEVTVGDGTCTNTSAPFFVTISQDIDPGSVGGGQTVCTGANSTLLTLSGTKGSIVRWESSTDGTNWTTIVNTAETYTATGLTQTTLYRAVVVNGSCPTKNSVATTVTVVPDPTISVQPAAATSECIGGSAVLSVTAANGTGGYTYQWYNNGSSNSNTGGAAIEGATGSTYTPPTSSAGTVYYYVIVGAAGSGCGTATSTVASVTTVATTPSWTGYNNPVPTTLCVGETVAFSAGVTGGSGGTVTWIRSATSGAAGTTVTTGDIPAVGTWYYRATYTPTCSGCNLLDGTETMVTVKAISAAPVISTITSGGVGSTTSTVVGTSTEADGTTIQVFKAGTTSLGFVTVSSNGWTISGLTLATEDVITAKATASGKCVSPASNAATIPDAPSGSASQSFCSGN